jgi:hypothetical protein
MTYFLATISLSPVTTFTSTPNLCKALMLGSADGLAGSEPYKTGKSKIGFHLQQNNSAGDFHQIPDSHQ